MSGEPFVLGSTKKQTPYPLLLLLGPFTIHQQKWLFFLFIIAHIVPHLVPARINLFDRALSLILGGNSQRLELDP